MFYKIFFAAATIALFASQAVGAPADMNVPEARDVTNLAPNARAVLIAANPIAACNCPDNCQHNVGDSCAFYHHGNVLNGECHKRPNHPKLKCVV
ncbi:hypothetical protein K505DRAFT_358518 [Melanomma pulvis-pyrius CBS 109.77]|uniref:Uncharacterized protein n=1 Tax=Melanomma pulvis-pyrius CBS 109.77 TaxID=1314802 RepID=A0A6A6XMZ5_9PLEO|nr:hypothetical protein K505DRAFT_358518 [Melanomma pulvis-pyrius CBS 109.77]